jgi:hypothetical protein
MRSTQVIETTTFASVPGLATAATAVCAVPAPYDSTHEMVVVSAEPRTAFQWLSSLAGAIGVALLVPLSILVIGIPLALAVRGILEAAVRLLALLWP